MTNTQVMEYWLESSDDDYKKEFAQKCTQEYVDIQLENIEGMRTWLKTQLM